MVEGGSLYKVQLQRFKTPLRKMKWMALSTFYQCRLLEGSLPSKHAELHQWTLTRECCIVYWVLCYCIVLPWKRIMSKVQRLSFVLNQKWMVQTCTKWWKHGDARLACSNIFKGFGGFQKGCESVEDGARAGCPCTSWTVNNIERGCVPLKIDRRMSIKMLTDRLNIDKEMKKVWVHFVLYTLKAEQTEEHVSTCEDYLKSCWTDSEFWKKIVMGDESWCFVYNSKKENQSSEWVDNG